MRNRIRAAFSSFRRTATGSADAGLPRHVLRLPDDCIVDVLLFLRRTDADTASITCRFYHRILAGVAAKLPLRDVHQLRLDYDRNERHHQVFFEDHGGNCVRRKIRRLGEWLSRLSHCYLHLLTVWAFALDKFQRRQFNDDIARCQPASFHVERLEFHGKSGSAHFDTRLYNFLMRPALVPQNIEVNEFLHDVMHLGFVLPRIIESRLSAEEIVQAFLRTTHSFEPRRFVFSYTSFLWLFERDAGFESLWPNGDYREAEGWEDDLCNDGVLVVYRPLINHFTGQKLRVLAGELSNSYKFNSEEKVHWRKEAERYEECIFLVVGCRARPRGVLKNIQMTITS